MAGQRADLGFGDALDGFDPADWAPNPVRERADIDVARKAAAATGFKSREGGQGGFTHTRNRTGSGQGAPPPHRSQRPAEP
jgi:hypothetical protein